MADTTTTNLGLTKPEIGASADTWGNKLNTDLDLVDGVFAANGTGTSVGINVGAGKVAAVAGTLNVTGTVSGGVVAPLASPTFTGTVTLPSTTSIGGVSATELVYLDGVTSNVQTQLDAKLAITTAASTYAPLASPAFTGTPTAPTASTGTNTTQVATTAFVQQTSFDSALPSQTGNAGKYVTTDGTNASWGTITIPPQVYPSAGVAISTGSAWGTSVAPGTSGNILTSNGTTWTSAAPSGSTLQATASGTLLNGSTVIVNVDGTVSVAAGVAQAAGSSTAYVSANTEGNTAVYDPNTQKVVIAYRDNGNSQYGTAVVGTVSGTSISFGTPVVFKSAFINDSLSSSYHSVAQKVVIAYNGGTGKAIVGTVSGTSISFGAEATFETGGAARISSAYDANTQKIVIACQGGASSFGIAVVGTVSGTSISFGSIATFRSNFIFDATATVYDAASQKIVIVYNSSGGSAIVGTVSGTSISFGTAVVFDAGGASLVSAAYDSTAQKVVIAYADGNNSSFGTAIVGAVSGTVISFGFPVVFDSAVVNSTATTFDANTQKIVITYQDGGNSNFGTAIAGTVSGTAISFEPAFVFKNANCSIGNATYHTAAQKIVIAYRDNGNSAFGTATVYTAPSTNLTSENFIGFSNAAYTNGQTATIQLVGAVDDAQSGLTPGQAYYVQNNGTLGLAPASPSVFAGTAVAANKIIVKG